MTATNNTLVGANGKGGGCYLGVSDGVFTDCNITGNVIFSNAIAFVNSSDHYISPPESNISCLSLRTINQPFGSLTDGSLGPYLPKSECMWLISPKLDAISSAAYCLRLNVTRFDTELGYDFVSFFDGPSSFSPLIGKFSGTPISSVKCQQGQCPSISSIVTTGLQLTVLFTSDGSINFDGFAFEWSVEAVYNRSGDAGLFPTDLPSAFASGGAIHSESSNVSLNRCLVTYNSVTHPLLALGGAIFVSTSASEPFILTNTTLEHNTVTANSAAGGALFVSQGVTVLLNVFFRNNAAVGTGWCFANTQGSFVTCPASFGGAAAVSSGASVQSDSVLFSLNTARCYNQYSTSCTANGAAMSVGGNISFSISICAQNTVVCNLTLGCTRGFGGCFHGTSNYLIFLTPLIYISKKTLGFHHFPTRPSWRIVCLESEVVVPLC